MTEIIQLLILILFFLMVYPFAIYPIILVILHKFAKKDFKKDESFIPEITFVISVFNEQEYIEKCIRSIYNSGYPNDKFKVLVGSDGSTDKTNSILEKLRKEYSSLDYRVFKRIGKNQVLNNLINECTSDYIYFFDGDMEFPSASIHKIVSYLADEKVGAVFCNVSMQTSTSDTGGLGEKIYQKLESTLRTLESQISTTVNSFGAILVRREIIKDGYPNDRIPDDSYTILKVADMAYRAVFIKDIEILELRPKSLKGEYKRRIRMVAAFFSVLTLFKDAMRFKKSYFSFFLYSHKVIRVYSPFYLIFVFILSILIEDSNFGKWALLAQFILYSSAFAGYALELLKAKIKFFKIPLFYLVMCYSFLIGYFRFLTNKQNSIWNN